MKPLDQAQMVLRNAAQDEALELTQPDRFGTANGAGAVERRKGAAR
jgi:hypothetical protein